MKNTLKFFEETANQPFCLEVPQVYFSKPRALLTRFRFSPRQALFEFVRQTVRFMRIVIFDDP